MRNSKFFYKFIWLFCFVILLAGCRKSVDSYVKEATKAMNEGDYAKAYEIVDIMYTIKPTSRDYMSFGFGMFSDPEIDYSYVKASDDLNEKIIKHEIGDIIAESEGKEYASKILFIIDERGREKWRKENLLEYAVKISKTNYNDELANVLEQSK